MDTIAKAIKFGEDVKVAVDAIKEAVVMFENDQGEEGLNAIIVASSEFMMKQTEDENEKQKLQKDTDVFLELVATGADLVEWKDAALADLALYADNGDLHALARAVSSTIDMYIKFFPDVDDETKQALDGFEMIVIYTVDYLALIDKKSTDQLQATEDYYHNLANAVVTVLGGEENLTVEQQLVIGALDATIGNLVNIVTDYTKNLLTKELCHPVHDVTPPLFEGKPPTNCNLDDKQRELKYGKCIEKGGNLWDSFSAPEPVCSNGTQKCHGNCVDLCPGGSNLETPPFLCHCKLEGNCPITHPKNILFGVYCGMKEDSLSKYFDDLREGWTKLRVELAAGTELEKLTNVINAGIDLRSEIAIPTCALIQEALDLAMKKAKDEAEAQLQNGGVPPGKGKGKGA